MARRPSNKSIRPTGREYRDSGRCGLRVSQDKFKMAQGHQFAARQTEALGHFEDHPRGDRKSAMGAPANKKFTDRMIVVLPINDLRTNAPVLIPSRLSWESTAENLVHELRGNPVLSSTLGQCKHVVVSLGTAGALVWSDGKDATLHYDPRWLEGEWENARWGRMMGYSVVLTAAIARRVVLAVEGGKAPALADGIDLGVNAMRELYRSGYRCRKTGYEYLYDKRLCPPSLCFPSPEVAGYMEIVAESQIGGSGPSAKHCPLQAGPDPG